jgi:hypothetical protein
MSRDARTTKIATVALHLAMRGDFEEAANYVKRLNGSDGLVSAILAWIDTFIGRLYPDHEYGQPIAVRFLAVETGAVESADEVGAAKAWAGRLISYRAADDQDGFNAVLRSLPEGRALGDGIMALLGIVADSLNNADKTRAVADSINRGAS